MSPAYLQGIVKAFVYLLGTSVTQMVFVLGFLLLGKGHRSWQLLLGKIGMDHSQFRGSAHDHGGEHGSGQADMVLATSWSEGSRK